MDDSRLGELPATAALALAVRCAILARPWFENRWDDYLDDAVDGAIEASTAITTAPDGTALLGPDGFADHCVDLSGLANRSDLLEIGHAANAAAGAAYCAAMVADVRNGYRESLPSYYVDNVRRAVRAAASIDALTEKVADEVEAVLAWADREKPADLAPIALALVENGFRTWRTKRRDPRTTGVVPRVRAIDGPERSRFCVVAAGGFTSRHGR